jgi:drug/metabolite transporter (DMT)-like permease
MFGTFIPALFAIAQTQIDSSVSSILNSLTPLNTLILGALVLDYNSNAIKFLVF